MPELVELSPEISTDHDDVQYHIEIGLPGVKKEDIDLEMTDLSFCIKASKEDIVYNACYTLAHSIDISKVETSFENGLLVIIAPFQHALSGTKITIK